MATSDPMSIEERRKYVKKMEPIDLPEGRENESEDAYWKW